MNDYIDLYDIIHDCILPNQEINTSFFINNQYLSYEIYDHYYIFRTNLKEIETLQLCNLNNISYPEQNYKSIYEYFDSIIYHRHQRKILAISSPELTMLSTTPNIHFKSNKDKKHVSFYQYQNGFTFHLFAENITEIDGIMDILDDVEIPEDFINDFDSNSEWEICSENDGEINTTESINTKKEKFIKPIENTELGELNNDITIWNIIPVCKINNETYNIILSSFYAVFTEELSSLLDRNYCYTIRYQDPQINIQYENPKIIFIEAFKIKDETTFEYVSSLHESLEEKILYENSKEDNTFPLCLMDKIDIEYDNKNDIDDKIKEYFERNNKYGLMIKNTQRHKQHIILNPNFYTNGIRYIKTSKWNSTMNNIKSKWMMIKIKCKEIMWKISNCCSNS